MAAVKVSFVEPLFPPASGDQRVPRTQIAIPILPITFCHHFPNGSGGTPKGLATPAGYFAGRCRAGDRGGIAPLSRQRITGISAYGRSRQTPTAAPGKPTP
jgi:hypothetical protein